MNLMKKHILSGGLLLLAAAFTACTEDFKDWASPQTNGAEDAITIPGFKASPVTTQDLADADDAVSVYTLDVSALPAGFTFGNARVDLVPSGVEGAEATQLKANNNGAVSKEELQELIEESFGKRPTERTFDAHVYVNAMKDGQAVFVDAGIVSFTAIPEAPAIANNYYMIGGPAGWSAEGAYSQKFTHSDADVYEDSYFTYTFRATSDEEWFAIGSDEAIEAVAADDWTRLLGIVGGDNTATTGSLDFRYNMGADNSFCVKGASGQLVRIVIDMMESTFTVSTMNIAERYYLIGGPGEWNAESARTMQFSHSAKDVFEDPVFTYTFASTGGEMWFAFGDAAAIDAVAAGTWNQLYGTKGDSKDLNGSFDRRYNLDGDHSFCVDGSAKFYNFTVNMMTLEYTITPLNFDPFIYFIGATDGWSAAEQKLALTDDSGIYTGYVYCADPNGWGNEFKFQKVPGNWDTEINTGHMIGGISGDFADGGGNFKATAGEGVYYVTLNMATRSITATRIQNMNIVGDFNGWNPADDAQQMTWDAARYCFVITGASVNGNGWKFTANNSWSINLGGNDSVEPSMNTGDLVGDGKNLGAVGATIRLYPTRKNSDRIYCTVE